MGVTVDQIRVELKARLEADEYFSDIVVVDYREKDLVSEINKLLGGLSGKNGKNGAFVYLEGFAALLRTKEPPASIDRIVINAVCIEVPILNTATGGTGKSAWDIAVRVVECMCGYRPDGLAETILVDQRAIAETEPPPGARAYQVPIEIPAHIDITPRCAKPALTADGATPLSVTITCATSGAAVYYTTDESYPWSGNTKATLYSSPIALSKAATIRAVAHKTGHIASDSALGIYS